jgi:hypothetical protein
MVWADSALGPPANAEQVAVHKFIWSSDNLVIEPLVNGSGRSANDSMTK